MIGEKPRVYEAADWDPVESGADYCAADGKLRYAIGERSESAFAELVRRHGPMVWGVCWRLLSSRQDAEDCYQATFLVLVRKGGTLRDPGDRDRLRRALAEGVIDAVCSDHTPVDEDAKQVPFAEAEPGATGLELLLPLTLQWGKEMGLKPVEALGTVTHRSARVLGIGGGTLAAGAPADICLFDPAQPWIVQPDKLASQGKNTPFLGLELTGRVVHTIVAGRTVFTA